LITIDIHSCISAKFHMAGKSVLLTPRFNSGPQILQYCSWLHVFSQSLQAATISLQVLFK